MKTKNTKKIVVSALAVAMGAGLVGSISGTVAWYQYSTRSTVAYTGASAHCSENLQVRIVDTNTTGYGADGDWDQDLTTTEIAAYLTAQIVSGTTARGNSNLKPITSGALALDAVPSTFYRNPIYQYESYTTWGTADKTDYVEIPLQFRVVDVDGNSTETLLAKKIYLTDLTIEEKTVTGKANIINALRVGIVGADNSATLSATGADVDVYGKLDLNQDDSDDKKPGYDFQTATDDCVYGDNEKVAKSYVYNSSSFVANDADPYNISGGKVLGTTTTTGNMLSVTVRIWLEGWQKLGTSGSEKAIWEAASYIGSAFNVGMRFTAEAHTTH